MTPDPLFASLYRARAAITNWMDDVPEERRALLGTDAMAQALTRAAFIDGYLRIRRTLPLILKAVERLDALGRRKEAAFWIDHLKEEAFHDEVMRADLDRLLGGARAATVVLRKARITPPSAAMLGYFEWQTTLGNPGLLIAMRLFLEWYVAGLEEWRVAEVHAVVEGGSQIMLTHRELDQDHVRPCADYVRKYCGACEAEVYWSVEFVGRCLRDAQLFLADALVERRA